MVVDSPSTLPRVRGVRGVGEHDMFCLWQLNGATIEHDTLQHLDLSYAVGDVLADFILKGLSGARRATHLQSNQSRSDRSGTFRFRPRD